VPGFGHGVKKRRKEKGRRKKNCETEGLLLSSVILMKECPLCGESMRLKVREIQDSIPGAGHAAVRVLREWVCPECDYFEEAEPGDR
jgi:hypothetical protein